MTSKATVENKNALLLRLYFPCEIMTLPLNLLNSREIDKDIALLILLKTRFFAINLIECIIFKSEKLYPFCLNAIRILFISSIIVGINLIAMITTIINLYGKRIFRNKLIISELFVVAINISDAKIALHILRDTKRPYRMPSYVKAIPLFAVKKDKIGVSRGIICNIMVTFSPW